VCCVCAPDRFCLWRKLVLFTEWSENIVQQMLYALLEHSNLCESVGSATTAPYGSVCPCKDIAKNVRVSDHLWHWPIHYTKHERYTLCRGQQYFMVGMTHVNIDLASTT